MERRISLEELEAEISIILHTLKVRFSKLHLIKDISVQFICEQFGTVVCGMERADYGHVAKMVKERLPDYRYIFISNFDDLIEAKQRIIWALMAGGYMKYIRENFNRQFTQFLTMNNYAWLIIEERLRRWGNRPKYKYMAEENQMAKTIPVTMILSSEPCFFDYMPEEEI